MRQQNLPLVAEILLPIGVHREIHNQEECRYTCQGLVLIMLTSLVIYSLSLLLPHDCREKRHMELPGLKCHYRSVITILVQGSFSVTL